MQIFKTIESYQSWRNSLHTDSTQTKTSIGFVPTMGALHAGHARLLEVSAQNHSHTVLSIFVNPTQFGPHEDLSKYPKTLDADLDLARRLGVSAVFLPTTEILYPQNYSTYVTEETISKPLCGVFRPTHFRGVTTIVLKLFNIIEPHEAYFGLKDAQQFFVIEQMVRDLNLKIKLTGVPTVRESTGLALSSRNIYLSPEDRSQRAPKFYEILSASVLALKNGARVNTVLTDAREKLTHAGFEVQYFELRVLPNFEDLSSANRALNLQELTQSLLAGAVFLPNSKTGVRLIDNMIIN